MLLELLQRNASQFPDEIAVVEGRERVTHRALLDRVERLAQGLSGQGVGRGDRVALFLGNSIDFVASFYAISACRAVVVPIDVECKREELGFYLTDAGVSLLITDRARLNRAIPISASENGPLRVITRRPNALGYPSLEELSIGAPLRSRVEQALDDDLIWLYTSGSTGRPRCVPRTIGQYLAELDTMIRGIDLDETDVIFCAIPLTHNYGAVECMLAATGSRARLVILDNPTPFALHRHRAVKLIEQEGVTIFPTVPYIVELLGRGGSPCNSLASLRHCYAAAAPLTDEAVEAFSARFGVQVLPHYGSTETGAIAIYRPEHTDRRPGSVGRLMPAVEVRIVDNDGKSLPIGEVGEVLIKTAGMTRGYRSDSCANDETFRGGYFHSGDLGYLDTDGNLYLTGRKKFLIDVVGQKFSPMDVEHALQSNQNVGEALVLRVPSKTGDGPIVHAFVTLTGNCGERELIGFCRDRLASFKVPKRIDFVSMLPKDTLGKKIRDLSLVEQQICSAKNHAR